MGNVKENFKRSCLNGGMIAAVVIPLALFAEALYEGGLLQKTDVDILSAYALPMALSNYLQFACLFPILPFALSYCEDKNSGYLKYILQRQGRKKYIRNRIFWCGISGGVAGSAAERDFISVPFLYDTSFQWNPGQYVLSIAP